MLQTPGGRLSAKALDLLPFEPLPIQRTVLCAAADFAAAGGPRDVFVLNGYAGTGKTSLMGALIAGMRELRMPVVVLAPTGRAAKVASSFAGAPASTIHRRLYRPVASTGGPGPQTWFVAPNQAKDTLFVVDEASLIPDNPLDTRSSLLHVLAAYVYSAPGCKLLLVGDEAQLPPVGQAVSTAMEPDRLRAMGLNPFCFSLDVPVRQTADSGIIHNATIVRGCLLRPECHDFPPLDYQGLDDFVAITSAELADELADSFATVGEDQTLIITRSNKRANRFNQAVRNMVMYAEEPLERGNRIVISKNDYYWAAKNKLKTLIANGDLAEVTWVGKTEKVYGRFFTEVELRLSDGSVANVQVMLRSLATEGPAIPRQEMERFYNVVLAEHEGEISERINAALADPYYNALQAKYAYCVTCHKAQGGQWKHVYIDMGGIAPDAIGPDFYRWLYTAITRATEKVYLINPPHSENQ